MLGSPASTQIGIQAGSIVASTVGTTVVAPALVNAGIFAAASTAIPVIGAAVAGITLAVSYLAQGCGATCTMTSNFVNQVEPYMKQNVEAWQSSGKSCAEKQQCISNFEILWQKVEDYCNNSQFGDAGKRCISDRSRGGKWDWFSYYLDPIQNDTCSDLKVVNGILDPVTTALASTGIDSTSLLAIGALVLGGMFLATSN